MIEAREVTKSFGHRVALSDVNVHIGAGELVALVGPNGAGKTTLLRVLATLTRPTAGWVRIAGLDTARAGEDARRRIGFLSHHTLLYGDLTAEENLRFYARLYDLQDSPARIDESLARVGLQAQRRDPVRTFSRGMQQRLAVARATLHHPQVLLLDEPFNSLDAQATQMLTDLLTELADGDGAVLLTTHDLARALALGRRVIALDRGRIVHDARREATDPATFGEFYRALST
jgi:heme exporter protein A